MNKTPYPKSWKKTPEQAARLWESAESLALWTLDSAKVRSVAMVKFHIKEMLQQIKQIERAQVANAIDSSK